MRPAAYAQAIVVARAIKSRLLSGDVLREAALAKDLGEALLALRESIYPGVGEAKTLTQALSSLWTGFFKTVERLASVTPGEALDCVLAVGREQDLRDLLTVTYRAASERPLEERLPSTLYEGTLTYSVARDPELLTSPQKILEFTEKTWAYSYVEASVKLARELKGLPAIWTIPLMVVRLYQDSMRGLGGAERRGLERVLCPHLEYEILSALVTAKHLDIPAKYVDTALEGIDRVCGVSGEELRGVYGREADPLGLAGELKGVLGSLKVEGKTVGDLLLNALRSSRQAMKVRALNAMSGYPFNPAFLVASLTLLRLEVEALAFILSSKEYRLSPADIVDKLAIEGL